MDASLAGGDGPIAHRALRVLASLVIVAVLGSCAVPGRHGAAAPIHHRAGAQPTPAAAPGRGLTVALGGEIDGLAAGGGYLWAYVRDSGALTRVDQRTGRVRRFPLTALRGLPVVVAASAQGVWLADQHSTRPELLRVDPQTGRVVARPHLPGVGPITGLAAAYGWLWVLVPDDTFPPGWRVIRVSPATNRVDGISANTPGTQLTGHTAAIQASAGKLWITGSMNVIVSLDPSTLAMHTAATRQLSEGLVFGDGQAWALNLGRPRLAEIDPVTGQVVRTLAAAPPSATGDDYVVAGHNVLWVFRGSHLSELDPATGKVITSTTAYSVAPAFYSPAVVSGTGLWYLAQTSSGTALDRILNPSPVPSPSPSAAARPVAVCAASQLGISLVDSGVATGHVGGVIGFINQGKAPCTLTGWPSLIAVTASGRTAVASHVLQTFFGPPSIPAPPVVTLRPGHRAEAALEGIDLPLQSKRCPPSYHSLRVTPPGGAHASVISAWLPGYGRYLPACATLSVSPVVRPSLLPY